MSWISWRSQSINFFRRRRKGYGEMSEMQITFWYGDASLCQPMGIRRIFDEMHLDDRLETLAGKACCALAYAREPFRKGFGDRAVGEHALATDAALRLVLAVLIRRERECRGEPREFTLLLRAMLIRERDLATFESYLPRKNRPKYRNNFELVTKIWIAYTAQKCSSMGIMMTAA